MATRRLRWQGRSRAEACREVLLAHVRRWLADWCATPADADLHVATGEVAPAEFEQGRTQGGARVWMASDADATARLGAILLGLPPTQEQALAATLADRALADLLTRFLPAVVGVAGAAPRPSVDELSTRFGSLVFAGDGALRGLTFCVDAAACDALVPAAAKAAMPKLSPRWPALAPEATALQVVLSIGEVTLADASDLRVGEVLLAGPLRDTPVQVRVPQGTPLLLGALSRAGNRLAVNIRGKV